MGGVWVCKILRGCSEKAMDEEASGLTTLLDPRRVRVRSSTVASQCYTPD